jgi:hypothetical protein
MVSNHDTEKSEGKLNWFRFKIPVQMLAAFSLLLLQNSPTKANGGSLDIDLQPVWTTGIISDYFGSSGVIVQDVNQDGIEEILACYGHVFALNAHPAGGFVSLWYGQNIGCAIIALGDRDIDGVSEIYTSTADNQIIVFDGSTFSELGRATIDGENPLDLATGDVDGDGELELVLCNENGVTVLSTETLLIEWATKEFAGTQVETGDIDGDGNLEIVVNDPGSGAFILNAALQELEWEYPGGFGVHVSLGDVDHDDVEEIAFIEDWGMAFLFEGDTKSMKWSLEDLADLNEVLVSDLDGNGYAEVIIADGQWGNVTGYDGTDGKFIWSIVNPEYEAYGLAAGDLYDDGSKDIVWGTGQNTTGKKAMIVGDWVTESIEYISEDLDGNLSVATGDIDLDGVVEIVIASHTSENGYYSGILQVFDGETYASEWSASTSTSGDLGVTELQIGQLDEDPALEILVGGQINNCCPKLIVFDGILRTIEWQDDIVGQGAPVEILIMNLDEDPIDEVIVGYRGLEGRVQVLNGASSSTDWDSGQLEEIRDISLGELDGDGNQELAILTAYSLLIVDTETWSADYFFDFEDFYQIAIFRTAAKQNGIILLYTTSYNFEVLAVDVKTMEVLGNRLIPDVWLEDIVVLDIDSDEDTEIVLIGQN